jgi:hypothetical protein
MKKMDYDMIGITFLKVAMIPHEKLPRYKGAFLFYMGALYLGGSIC